MFLSNVKGLVYYLRYIRRYEKRRRAVEQIADGNVRQAVQNLFTQGFHLIPDYWSAEKVAEWEGRLDQAFCGHAEDKNGQQRMGGIRWHNIEKDFPELGESVGHDPMILDVARAYLGVADFRKMSYQHSTPNPDLTEDRVRAGVACGDMVGLGQYWHLDSWDYGLKAVLYISDVDEGHGPFTAIPGTHHPKLSGDGLLSLKKCSTVWPPKPFDSDKLYFSGEEADRYDFESRAIKACGKRGTLALVDPRMIHRAALPVSDVRKVIWVYYY